MAAEIFSTGNPVVYPSVICNNSLHEIHILLNLNSVYRYEICSSLVFHSVFSFRGAPVISGVQPPLPLWGLTNDPPPMLGTPLLSIVC